MEQNLLQLNELSTESQKWSARVLLLEKTVRRTAKTTGNSFQRYIFVDSENTNIQGISYGLDTEVVDRVLKMLQMYLISNARITPCPLEYRIIEHSVQWILTGTTVMELVTDLPLPPTLGAPNFTPLSQLNQYKGTSNNIGNNLSLCLWNDLVLGEGSTLTAAATTGSSFPIVAALRVRVQSFRGLSISAKGTANVIVSPPYELAVQLKAWSTLNRDELQLLIETRPYFKTARGKSQSCGNPIVSIAAVINTQQDITFTVQGHVRLPSKAQRFYYMSCPTCFRSTTASGKSQVTCHFCNKKHFATPRAKFTVVIFDDLTQLEVAIFGEQGEQLIGLTADELLATSAEPIDVYVINLKLAASLYQLVIRKKEAAAQDSVEFYYNLVDITSLTAAPRTESKSPKAAAQDAPTAGNDQDTAVLTPSLDERQSHKCATPLTTEPKSDCAESSAEPHMEQLPRKSARLSSQQLLSRTELMHDAGQPSNNEQ